MGRYVIYPNFRFEVEAENEEEASLKAESLIEQITDNFDYEIEEVKKETDEK